MSAEAIAESRRAEEIRALTEKRSACERALGEWRAPHAYDPGGNLARAEAGRRADLERDMKRCDEEIRSLGKLKPADLVRKFVPEVERQRQIDELAAEGWNATDLMVRGPRR